SGFGTVDTDNAEVLGPYLLHARVDDPARLLQDLLGGSRRSRPFATASRNHCHASEKGLKITQFSGMAVRNFSGFLFLCLKPPYQGTGLVSDYAFLITMAGVC